MQVLGMIWGIFAIIGMLIAFIPLLGWMNWANIPFASVGLIISIIGVVIARGSKGMGIAGIVMCAIAIIWGAIRLKVGGGFF
jgi:hypothetical protein